MAEIFAQPVFALLIVLAVLVLVHELGHFLVGRAFGIGVEVFSIGFGPKLWSVKKNSTEYQIAILPLGGFVKFAGAYPGEPVAPEFLGQEMYKARPLARALTAFAGPFANLLLAVVIFTGFGFYGVSHIPAEIGYVLPDSPAEKGGLMSGDKVISINDQPIHTWDELRERIVAALDSSLAFEILRGDQTLHLALQPQVHEGESDIGLNEKQGRLGINPSYIPAVVTVIGGSPALQALPVGSEVVELKFAEQDHKIDSWSELLRQFSLAYQAKVSVVVLTYVLPGDDKTKKTIEVPCDPWYQVLEEFDTKSLLGQAKLARELGLADSQLTILEAEEGAKGILLPHDRIVAIEKQNVSSIYDLANFLQRNDKPMIHMEVVRQGKIVGLELLLSPKDVQKMEGKKTIYTLSVKFLGQERLPPPYLERYTNPAYALWFGVKSTADFSAKIGRAIIGLFTGDVPLKALGGPIIIAKVAGDAAELGLEAFLRSIALISINLGLINLVPIPALDGGQLVLVGTEALLRRPLSEVAIENYQRLGFVFLVGLVLIATYNDLSRFWVSMLRSVTSFF